jgi:hypothetical protein
LVGQWREPSVRSKPSTKGAQKGSQRPSQRKKGLLVDEDLVVRSKVKTKGAKKIKGAKKNEAVRPAPKLSTRNAPNACRRPILSVGSEQEIGEKLLEVLRTEGTNSEIVYAEGHFWEYDGKGRWVRISSEELHRIVGSFDGAFYKDGSRPKTVKISNAFALGAIKRAENLASNFDFFATASDVIVFSDVSVRVTGDGKIEAVKHSAEHRCRVGYNFPFDRNAQAPRFMQMQQDHFRDDADQEQKILVEQEFYGACLFGFATKFEKCLALPCDGGGGRSTKLKVIEAAFPEGLVSHLDARELKSAERRTRLAGKRLNFSDEVPGDAFLDSEEFKKVVTGNIITAEGKYRSSFEFRPLAGFVFPIQTTGAAELTDAFWRRFIFNRYNRAYEGDKSRVLDFAKPIIDNEIPGIVVYMIEGAARLLRQGKYTVPSSHFQEELKWKMAADTVRSFLETRYTRSSFLEPRTQGFDASGKPNGQPVKNHDWTQASELYMDYRSWCEANGHRKPVASPEFKRRVEKVGYASQHTRHGSFYGVRLLQDAQTKENQRAKAAGEPATLVKGAISSLVDEYGDMAELGTGLNKKNDKGLN